VRDNKKYKLVQCSVSTDDMTITSVTVTYHGLSLVFRRQCNNSVTDNCTVVMRTRLQPLQGYEKANGLKT